jgi:hypothetical protein
MRTNQTKRARITRRGMSYERILEDAFAKARECADMWRVLTRLSARRTRRSRWPAPVAQCTARNDVARPFFSRERTPRSPDREWDTRSRAWRSPRRRRALGVNRRAIATIAIPVVGLRTTQPEDSGDDAGPIGSDRKPVAAIRASRTRELSLPDVPAILRYRPSFDFIDDRPDLR